MHDDVIWRTPWRTPAPHLWFGVEYCQGFCSSGSGVGGSSDCGGSDWRCRDNEELDGFSEMLASQSLSRTLPRAVSCCCCIFLMWVHLPHSPLASLIFFFFCFDHAAICWQSSTLAQRGSSASFVVLVNSNERVQSARSLIR